MSFDSLIDKVTGFTEVEEISAFPNSEQTPASKVAGLDQSQLALRARQLEQRLARQKQAKERQQQIEQLVARSEYALGEAENRHQQTDSLHQTLLQLKQKIDVTIKEKQNQLDADREVLESYSASMSELQHSKQEIDQLLGRVSQLAMDSQEVTEQMTLMLTQGQQSQQNNLQLNEQLQLSLKESSHQQESLRNLIEQCNTSQDRSHQDLDKNRVVSEQLLERARTTCNQVEQGRLDAEQLIGDLNHNKAKSEELMSLLADLGKTGAENHQRNRSLNNQLEQSLKVSEESRALLMDLQADCRNAKQQATDALTVSQSQNEDSAKCLEELRSSLHTVEETRHQADFLLGDMRSASELLEQKLSTIDRIINEGSDSSNESKRLNQESVAVIEQSKQYTEKLAFELESSLKLNEQYQERLQRAEKNYQKTSALHVKYKALYEKSVSTLEEKTKLLEEAKTALNTAQSSNEDFTHTVKQFHQCTDQAQQMVLESQQTINSLLSENQSTRQPKLGSMPMASQSQQCNPAGEENRTTEVVQDTPLLDDFGLAYFADADFQPLQEMEPLTAGQQLSPNQSGRAAASGFFRIMMVIGLTLSLTFIISSAIKSSAAVIDNSAAELVGDRLLTSFDRLLGPVATYPVSSPAASSTRLAAPVVVSTNGNAF